ncbi:hypothetical protein H257_13689 [Aphanomyces astaci]|uniref:Uncharacterized protein n=1 Tax=Aphanomyces astaci TaxID=112090 RepID=W4FVH0_APHAT|nr:hypothetical protein H257_13689 [Aphanomyces astaci]ETV70951.1 hypothetical protein H257_13689 [Aphanomyces astaci]|eukprot:XP_009839614.1 hypothetical protein H257_13689 [Aphanomyces astaci]
MFYRRRSLMEAPTTTSTLNTLDVVNFGLIFMTLALTFGMSVMILQRSHVMVVASSLA